MSASDHNATNNDATNNDATNNDATNNNGADPTNAPLTHLVDLPLGTTIVILDRRGLSLGERGGFEARWADADESPELGPALSPEAYRQVVKRHLSDVFRAQESYDPPKVTLNLASHQLIDDLIGWSKLNARRRG